MGWYSLGAFPSLKRKGGVGGHKGGTERREGKGGGLGLGCKANKQIEMQCLYLKR